MNATALFSDADGTLIDTLRLIRHGQYEAAKQYLTNHGIPADEIPDYETYNELLTQVVGGSTRSTTESTIRLLYAASPHYLETIDFDELYSMLAPIQDRLAPQYVKAYPGLPDFLRALSKAGTKLAVFSSGSAHHIVRNFGTALPELGLQELYKDTTKTDESKLRLFEARFSEVFSLPGFTAITSEDTDRHKPEPDGLLLAMKRLQVRSSSAVVLGDHKVDMQAAAGAGISNRIGITHGFDDELTLKEYGASHIANSLDEASRLIGIASRL